MKTEPDLKQSDAESETTRAPRAPEPIRYIDTVDAADQSITGVTIVDKHSGQGVFHKDPPTTLPSVRSSTRREQVAAQVTSLRTLYPHWEDTQAEAGLAVRLVSGALGNLENALDSSDESSPELFNHLVLAEGLLFQAIEKARFNKAFELVVQFCAWAVRNGTLENPKSLSLESMCSALRELRDSPFIEIGRSAQIVAALKQLGWSGESLASKLFKLGLEVAGEETKPAASQEGPKA